MRVVSLFVVIAVDFSSYVTGVRVHDGDDFARLLIDVIVALRNPGVVFLMIVVIVHVIHVVHVVHMVVVLVISVTIMIMVIVTIVALNDVLNVTSVWVLDRDNFASLLNTMVVVISVVVVRVIRGALNNLVNDDSVLDDVSHSANGLVIMGVVGCDGVSAHDINDAIVVHDLALRFSVVRVVSLYMVIAVDLSCDVTGVRVNDGDDLASLLIDMGVGVWVVVAGVSVQMINHDFVVMVVFIMMVIVMLRVGAMGVLS